jgi:hypothetical protein
MRLLTITAISLLLIACNQTPKPLKEGKVTFISIQYAPYLTMLACQGKEQHKTIYTNVYEDADPYLEWFDHWAVLKYTIFTDGKPSRRHITVPFSSIYSFNWDWKKDSNAK